MDPKRWTAVNRIFHAAVEMPASDRDGFVSAASEGDAEIEQHVMRLLNADSEADSYLETPLVPAYLGLDSSPAPFEPGQTLKERFRIERHVGQGGMGHVFEASDLDLKVRVALKVIRPEIASNPAALEYFRREVRTARTITHINVCRTYDLDRYTVASGAKDSRELYFLTMEFLDGETLAERIRREGPVATSEARAIARQIAAGLNSAHAAGVIHRDLKPANIMLVPAIEAGTMTRVVIMDFGLARRDPIAAGASAISHGSLVGTLAYMAPEQLDPGTPVSAATDVYAFGLILFEMVTGQRAYPSTNLLSGIAQRISGSPPSAKALVPDVQDTWERAIEVCLRPGASDRFQSAAEVVEVLEDRTPATLDRARLGAVSRNAHPVRRPGRRWPVAAAVATALVGVSLFGVWLRLTNQSRNSRVTPGALVYMAPVHNQTGEKAFDNLTELLQEGLSQSVQINLLDQGRVGDTLQLMTKPPEKLIDPSIAREIAMRNGAVRVIFGTVTRSAGEYRLDIDIQEPDGSSPSRYRDHWAKSFSWSIASSTSNSGSIPPDLLTAVRKSSDWIRFEVGESRNDIARLDAPPEDVTTGNWEALASYAEAERLASRGKRAEAVEALRSAIHYDPQFAVASARMGDLQFSLGRAEDGFRSYDAALRETASNRLTRRERDFIKGTFAVDTRDFSSAEEAFRDCTSFYEVDAQCTFFRAYPLRMMGRSREAIDVLNRAILLSPSFSGAFFGEAQDYILLRDFDNANVMVGRLKSSQRPGQAAWVSGQLAFLRFDFDAAKDGFSNLIDSSSPQDRSDGYALLARVAAEQGRLSVALHELEMGLVEDRAQHSREAESAKLLDRAYLYCRMGKIASCMEDATSSLSLENRPESIIAISSTMSHVLANSSIVQRATILRYLSTLQERLPRTQTGASFELARLRVAAVMLLAKGETLAALNLMRKAEVLDSPLSGRDSLAETLIAAARQRSNPTEKRAMLEEALDAYQGIALHPETVWHYALEYPPGYFADQTENSLLLRTQFRELGTNPQLESTYAHLRGAFSQ